MIRGRGRRDDSRPAESRPPEAAVEGPGEGGRQAGQGGRAGQEGGLWRKHELWIVNYDDESDRAGVTQKEGAVVPSSGARLETLRRCKGAFRGVTDGTRGNVGTAAVPGRMGPVGVYAVDPATARGASY